MLESTKEDATGLPEGSDIGLGAGCRRFESCHLDQTKRYAVNLHAVFLLPVCSFTRTRTCFQSRREPKPHPAGACFESCHLDLVAVDAVSLAATFSKSLLAHFVTAPLPTRPAALGSCRSLLQHSVNLNAVFSFLHNFPSGFEPAFHRAVNRIHTSAIFANQESSRIANTQSQCFF